MLQINTNNQIILNGKKTAYTVHQTPLETAVICHATGEPVWCVMPQYRYSLAHDAPASGVAGRTQFEQDFIQMINN